MADYFKPKKSKLKAGATDVPVYKRKPVLIAAALLVVIVAAGSFFVLRKKPKVVVNQDTRTTQQKEIGNAVDALNKNEGTKNLKTFDELHVAAQIYAAKGQNQEAYDAYVKCIALAQNAGAQLYIEVGDAALAVDKKEEAKKYYNLALQAKDINSLGALRVTELKQKVQGL